MLTDKPLISLYIKTYHGDFKWLRHCLKSISKYAKNFHEVVIFVDEESREELETWGLTQEKIYSAPVGDERGYMMQQVRKLQASHCCKGEYIAFMDSDCIFTSEFDAYKELFTNGKPNMCYASYDTMDERGARIWQPVTTKFMQMTISHEFMRCLPIIYPKSLFYGLEMFCEKTHGMDLGRYIMSQPGHEFSEFNAFGAYCWMFHRELFHWIETDKTPRTMPLHQAWSWGGIKEENEKMFEELLK